jgi:hypothetical protein
VREEGRIEIETEAVRLRPIDPALEVLRLNLVLLDGLAAVVEVACVEIQAMFIERGECEVMERLF